MAEKNYSEKKAVVKLQEGERDQGGTKDR